MNNVNLIGRLTADIELRYTQSQKAVAQFTIAVDGYNDKTNFIRCVAWEKLAENLSNYCHKGSPIAVTGRLESGSYEKNGVKHYTQDVTCERIEFLERKSKNEPDETDNPQTEFAQIDEPLPF